MDELELPPDVYEFVKHGEELNTAQGILEHVPQGPNRAQRRRLEKEARKMQKQFGKKRGH